MLSIKKTLSMIVLSLPVLMYCVSASARLQDESVVVPGQLETVAASDSAASENLLPKHDADGNIVRQIRLSVYRASEAQSGVIEKAPDFAPYTEVKGLLLRDGETVADFQTNSNGQFTLEGLEEGFYDFVAESKEFGHFGNEEIMIKYDDQGIAEMKFQLSENGLTRLPNDLSQAEATPVSSEAEFQDEVERMAEPLQSTNLMSDTIPNYPQTPVQNYPTSAYTSGAAGGSGMGWGLLGLAGLAGLAGLGGSGGGDGPGPQPQPVSPAGPDAPGPDGPGPMGR